MGVPTELWRARIGGYFPGTTRARLNMAAINVQGKRTGVHLLLAFVMSFIVLPHAGAPQTMFTLESKNLFSLWEIFHDACIAQLPFEITRPGLGTRGSGQPSSNKKAIVSFLCTALCR